MSKQPLGLDLKSKKLRKRSDYPYHEDYRTRWQDNDMFHHINNPIYGVLIDSIINSFLITNCGYSVAKSEMVGMVANTYCDYFAAANYPGVLDIGLRVVKIGKASIMYEVGIFQQGDDQVKAVGGFVQIWVVRATNKVTSEGVPKWIKDPLLPLLKGGEQDQSLAKL